jgi:hypothetical protein
MGEGIGDVPSGVGTIGTNGGISGGGVGVEDEGSNGTKGLEFEKGAREGTAGGKEKKGLVASAGETEGGRVKERVSGGTKGWYGTEGGAEKGLEKGENEKVCSPGWTALKGANGCIAGTCVGYCIK